MIKKIVTLLGLFSILLIISVSAATKTWGGGGDGTSWSDEDNWYPAELPTASDDLIIDIENGSISADQTFNAKSITLGGRESTTLTTESFVFGTIEPDSVTDSAITNRPGGLLTLGGYGAVTLKGQYVDSQTDVDAGPAEPSFMLWIE